MLKMWKALLKTQEFSHFNTNFQPQGTEIKQLFNITALIPHSFQPCVENYVERRFFKTYILIFENLSFESQKLIAFYLNQNENLLKLLLLNI